MKNTVKEEIWSGVESHLWKHVLLGLALGVLFGIALGPDLEFISRELAATIGKWVALPGKFFLAVIQMIVIPLVVSSVICGIAGGSNVETVKKLGLRIVFYFLLTTTVAVSVGAAIATLIEPGLAIGADTLASLVPQNMPEPSAALVDNSNIPARLVGLIPRNPFHSIASGEMLQIVIFATVLGAALLAMPKAKSTPFLEFTASLQEACMVVVGWILKLAPYAVFGLIADLTIKLGVDALAMMLSYMGTVIAGLLLMVVFYTSLLVFISGKKPLAFFKQIREAQLLAFSTSSSSATMPVTLRVAEDHVGVKPAVARFTVPLGATINMDGTALYQTVATLFLAQAFGIDIGILGMLTILITAIAASIGTPGTPGVGIVVLATILSTVGIPAEGIALILGVDRILDMCRTTVNVTGDLVACTVMEKLLAKRL